MTTVAKPVRVVDVPEPVRTPIFTTPKPVEVPVETRELVPAKTPGQADRRVLLVHFDSEALELAIENLKDIYEGQQRRLRRLTLPSHGIVQSRGVAGPSERRSGLVILE